MHSNNPSWAIEVLDGTQVESIRSSLPLSATKFEKLSIAHQSDLLRTKLLIDNGGVWIDSTVWLNASLDDWLPSVMDAGVFFFSRPGRDRMISNWFIAAEQKNELLQTLLKELCAYWQDNDFRNVGRPPTRFESILFRAINRDLRLPGLWFSPLFTRLLRIHPYMVYHYLLARICRNHQFAARMLDAMPEVSAVGPHRLQRLGLLEKFDDKAQQVLTDPDVPLQKLTWKLPVSRYPEASIAAFLCRQATE